jgi:hypothetical protein
VGKDFKFIGDEIFQSHLSFFSSFGFAVSLWIFAKEGE